MTLSREIKVGFFALMGLVLTGVVVFLIGDQRNMFARKVDYVTSFHDVQGLAPGAPVRMDGINVGSVRRVGHSNDLNDPRIHVEIWMVRTEALRLRKDARAKVVNKGMLGDKMLEIEPGSPELPAFGLDGHIQGEDPTDFSNLVGQVGSIAERTNSVMGNLDKASATLAEEKVQQDLRGSIHSVNVILNHVAEGDGYVNKLLSDPSEAKRLSRALENFERTSSEMAATAVEFRQLITRINRGPGFAHSVIYEKDGNEAVESLGGAANEIALTLRGIRQGDGIARAMLYGGTGDEAEIMSNLNAASSDLRHIMEGLKKGKGTLGALLVDPSVYEDMKVVLGNVERNEVLRALVRYSIRQDEKQPTVQVQDPATPSPKPVSSEP
ncbi:MAG: ABC transporter substrate-binding protein [Sorangium cellulosum]|nr:MAG: ABC transporter substrate-binding protein [Sorangium cellulosum]